MLGFQAGGEAADRSLTALLNRMHSGDENAGEQAVEMVYRELHGIAARELRRESSDHLLQTTALIHEAYLRLIGSETLHIQSRNHFFALAAQQMRRILIDFARARDAQRRGGGAVKVELDRVQVGTVPRKIDLLSLDEALAALSNIDNRAAQVVELRFFGGYSDTEIAEVLAISPTRVRRDWEFARSWLFDRMYSGGKASSAY